VKTTLLLLVPVGVVTVTKYVVPVVMAGETAVMLVDPITLTFVAGTVGLPAVPPDSSTKLTVAPVTKPVPVIVTAVPPDVGPTAGDTKATTGTSPEYVKTALLV
jgi:hypothetical protein